MRAALVLTLAFLAVPCLAQDSNQVTIKLDKDLSIADFLDYVSKSTNKPLIYDPNNQRIRGQKLGMGFTRTVHTDRLFDVCRAILAFFELNLIPVGPREYQIHLVVDSRSTNNLVKNRALFVDYRKLDDYADRDGVYIASAVRIKHIENLTTLRTALSTMVSPAGIGRVHEVPGSQSIIVMDFAPNVAAMARLIKQMDVAPAGSRRVLEVIELQHASAKELAAAVNEALANAPAPAPTRGRVAYRARRINPKVVPYVPRNALLVSCLEADFESIRGLVAALDKPTKRLQSVESR